MSALPRPRLVIGGLALGTMLNPLNSTMITVALAPIAADLSVSFAAVTWTVTAFFLVSCAAQPVLGRLADAIGPKRAFLGGMAVASAASVWAALSADLLGLALARGLLALGTAAAFPGAVTLLRSRVPAGRDSARALGAIQAMNFLGMAIGPVLGAFLLSASGWSAQFWANPVIAAAAAAVVGVAAPSDATHRRPHPGPDRADGGGGDGGSGSGPRATRALLGMADLPGVLSFVVAVGAAVLALLDSVPGLRVPVALGAVVAGAFFVWWELRAGHPFLDLRALGRNGALLGVIVEFGAFNAVFYLLLFGLPQHLESTAGMPVTAVGALLALLALSAAATTGPAARLVGLLGVRTYLLGAAGVLLVLLALLLTLAGSPAWWHVAVLLVVLGIPYGLIPLGLNQAMYAAADDGAAGVAAGLLQFARYFGGVIAMAIMALVVPDEMGAGDWPRVVAAMLGAAVLGTVLIAAVGVRRRQ